MKKDYNGAPSRKDGTIALYLFVEIERERKKFPLEINWPLAHFDEEQGICLPRMKKDKDCSDNNILLQVEKGKANDIIKFYRLKIMTSKICKH